MLPVDDVMLVPRSLAVVVESCHITICYTIGVYMVHHFLDNSADESQIGTLTGLLVGAILGSRRSASQCAVLSLSHGVFTSIYFTWRCTCLPLVCKYNRYGSVSPGNSFQVACAVVFLFFGAAHNRICLGSGQRPLWPQAADCHVKPFQYHIHANVWPG